MFPLMSAIARSINTGEALPLSPSLEDIERSWAVWMKEVSATLAARPRQIEQKLAPSFEEQVRSYHLDD